MARSLFTLSPARESASRRPALPSIPMIVLSFTLVLAGIVGGSLLALQGQARPAAPADTTARTDNPALVDTTIRNLEADQASLKRSLAAAREQLDTLQATSAQEKAQLADVTSALAAEQVTAGLVPLTGPGVIAVFQDSTAATVPANEDPANYIVHDYNLRDVVNTLWASGAEAISVNGERVLATTSLYCVGTTIIVNVTRLSPPYEVRAIGDPTALSAALHTAPAMQALLGHAAIYDEPVAIDPAETVAVPAFSGALTYKYAHPGDSVDAPTPVTRP